MIRELGAEFVGTFALVIGGCGAALFSAPICRSGRGRFRGRPVGARPWPTRSGHISGGHFNPAVTHRRWSPAGRCRDRQGGGLTSVAQVFGGIAARGGCCYRRSSQGAPAGKWNTFTAISNTLRRHRLLADLGAADRGRDHRAVPDRDRRRPRRPTAPPGFAPIAIGLALTLFHLVAIPVSNASLNPARSTATAIFGGAEALGSLWLFWVAPIAGGVIGGCLPVRWLQEE